MAKISHILAVMDPTEEAQPALERSADLATKLDASVTALLSAARPQAILVEGGLAITFDQYRSDLHDAYQHRLEQTVADLKQRFPGVSVEPRFQWHTRLYDGILEAQEDSGADLVMKDTHYHSAVSRAVYTNTDWHLIRDCPVALWLTKPSLPSGKKAKIVACVDAVADPDHGPELDDVILETAGRMADVNSAELHVLHVYQPLREIGNAAKWAVDPTRLPVEELNDKIRSRHGEAFSALCDRHGIADDRRHLLAGSVRSILPACLTDLSASLAVLGAASRRNLREYLIGNTSEAILDHAPCDVLIVKESD